MITAIQVELAVGYLRASSFAQAGVHHVSLEVQEAAIRDYCEANGLELVKIFTDVASGRKDDRAQYRCMLAFVAEQGIGNMVVLYLDRFGRNPNEILRRYWELQEQGVTVRSINENLEEEELLLLKAVRAGAESKRTSERVTMALRKAAEQGKLVSKLPFGYTKIYDSKGKPVGVEQVPREAAAIRLAHELATVGNLGYKAIADELNRLGYRTKSGAPFASQSLKLILLNPAMAGHSMFKGQGEPIIRENAYPAILNPEEWDTLQLRLTIRRDDQHRGRTNTSLYLLTGILRCGHCQGAITGSSSGPNRHRYYVCTNKKMARALCDQQISHRKEGLEEAILNHIGQYSDPEMVRQLLESQGKESDTRDEAELERVSARLGELDQAFLDDMDRVDRSIMTEPEFVKRQEVRREEQEGLQALKTDLEARVAAQQDMESQVATVPVKVESFLEDFQGMDVQQAKAILQGIIRAAHVYNDGRIELEFR